MASAAAAGAPAPAGAETDAAEEEEVVLDTFLEDQPLFAIPGRKPEYSWRAPGDVDRASAGAAARVLYPAPPLHEACRTGRLADVVAALDGGAGVDDLDGVRAQRA
jgi:hypothetical protein